jgi:hypothetical protein
MTSSPGSRRVFLKTLGGAVAALTAACRHSEHEPLGCPEIPDADLECRPEAGLRVIEADGLPAHPTGAFPNPGCPVPIRVQRHRDTMPLAPRPAPALVPLGWSELGVAITGVPFDPAGPYWRGDASAGWRFEVMSPVPRRFLGLDFQHAHVQPAGAYHYHGLAEALAALVERARGEGRPALLGFAADGFPIYGPWGHRVPDDPESPLALLRPSYRLGDGWRSGPGGRMDGTFVEDYAYVDGLGDLDAANGRFAITSEFPAGTYHYVAMAEFPFLPRFFRGRPDASFVHGGDPGLDGVPPPLRELFP